MPQLRLGMRWWLAATFGVIAVLTALLVAAVSSRQTDRALRANSEDLAVGKTVTAGFVIEQAIAHHTLGDALPLIAARRALALFVFGPDGRLVSSATSSGVEWRNVRGGGAVLAEALAGQRAVQSTSGSTLVGLPLRKTDSARAVVAYAPQPAPYGRSITIFRREVAKAALWATLAALFAGSLAATLIARRLRRIGAAAAAIEHGDFDVPLRTRFGDEVGTLALSIDRMRRRLRDAFEALRVDRDRLERLLEQLHEGVVAFDADLNVRFANPVARRLIPDLAEGEPLPASWSSLSLAEFAAGLFRADAQLAEARVAVEPDQTVAIVGVPAAGSELALLVLTDITEAERRERAEREFVANASHELRTPVTAIAGAIEALQAGAKHTPADRDHFLDLIGRQAARLTRLTRSMLLLARAQTGQQEIELERVELRSLLDDVVAAADPAEMVALDCPAGVVALTHRDMTEQIVLNLVGNALAHSHGAVSVAARDERESVVIEVTDSGNGIPPSVRRRMFDRFYSGSTGRRDGFGLGLAIARDAVDALGGTIAIESTSEGTTARVTLASGKR
jgi:signal transduction histidine kinase/HAMP domain-containing protein